jgi:hypothetical protein
MSLLSQHLLFNFSKRVDLHCHSRASTEADEAVLQAIHCPESYSEPDEIYAQAKQRGMDFVTITDHDSIAGVTELGQRDDVLVGEELTCYFPEDHCKIHVLVWGITAADHDELQRSAEDIHAVAAYIAQNNLAHAVAHPLYIQNGKLDRWHIERLLLMFRGFECLNGAHSNRHRQAFEPLLDELNIGEIRRLERLHKIQAYWPQPAMKSRTGGSDDHGLFNIGRTWTEFPEYVQTRDEVLDCLREGLCRPGGESGSSIKLAHNFYGVGMRFYTRQVAKPNDFRSAIMRKLLGEKPGLGKFGWAAGAIKWQAGSALKKISRKLGFRQKPVGTELLGELFASAISKQLTVGHPIRTALKQSQPALAEHQPVFDFIASLDREVAAGIFQSVGKSMSGGQIGSIFDGLSTITAHQALLLPYYFALFHQNQERHLLSRLTGRRPAVNRSTIRVGLFTDAAHPQSPASRFATGLSTFSDAMNLHLDVVTCGGASAADDEHWKTFSPLAKLPVPSAQMEFNIPSVLEVLEYSDRRQFDVILVNTCGPMGLCGWLASRMLRAPMIGVYHDDLPTLIRKMTGGDYRVGAAATGFLKWFYGQAEKILTRSQFGQDSAHLLGLQKTVVLPGRTARQGVSDSRRFELVWECCIAAASNGVGMAEGVERRNRTMPDENQTEAVTA